MKALKRTHTSSSNSGSPSSSSSSSSWIHLRSVLFIVANSSPASCSSFDRTAFDVRSRLKSPWSHRKGKHVLTPQQWRSVFVPDGKLRDGGVKVLKKVRSGGIHPSIRSEVWPYLLGVYDFRSSKEERDVIRNQNRKKYEMLRRQSRRLLKQHDRSYSSKHYSGRLIQDICSSFEEVESARESLSSTGERSPPPPDNSVCLDCSSSSSSVVYLESNVSSRRITSSVNTDSSETDSSDDDDAQVFQASSSPPSVNSKEEKNNLEMHTNEEIPSPQFPARNAEDFAMWQRIIRVDAVRANLEWMPYSYTQAAVSDTRARHFAEAVGLKDYDHLDPYRIFHAARLVAILEAYAVFDPEIGYCQGMSDLLSPIVAIISEDHEAFWCFVGFMKKARHNFRLDEVGIRRQLSTVSKIIKFKDSHLYRHLQKFQAEDCFFVYRMVVVLFRRELTFKQTMCLWEVMWADQAAIRAGIGNTAWSRIRQQAPPTDDLLLYAIAASVLQRRKLIIQRYSSMDEILRECNSMSGQLDVWKLLDDAHDLVVSLHEKVK